MRNEVIFFGDCIVKGTVSYYINGKGITKKTQKSPCQQISKYFNIKIKNRGYERSGLSRMGCIRFDNETKPNPNNSLYNKLLNEDLSKTETLLMWLPSNDFGASCPLDNYKETLEEIIKHIHDNYPLVKIAIISTHERYVYRRRYIPEGCLNHKNKVDATLKDYNKIASDICKQKNIPFLEINDFTFVNEHNNKDLLPDMLHPTQQTLDKLMYIIITWLENNKILTKKVQEKK